MEKEIFEKIKRVYSRADSVGREIMEREFPELAESEDERIRKSIIQTLEFACAHKLVDYDAVVKMKAYLEKQKESLHIPETCKENADSFTDEDERMVRDIRLALLSVDDAFWATHSLTAKEAIAWLEKQKEQKPAECEDYAMFLSDKCEHPSGICNKKGQKLLTKQEFCDYNKALHKFKVFATKQAKEHNICYIKDIEWDNFCVGIFSYFYKLAEWSEEDEEMRKLLIAILEVNHPDGFFKANELGTTDMRGVHTDEIISWLKFLGSNLKKKNEDIDKLCSNELSEEDKKVYNFIYDFFEHCWWNSTWDVSREQALKMLKSFRPSWKPSEEQIYSLGTVVKGYDECTVGSVGYHLKEMYKQLKKLI